MADDRHAPRAARCGRPAVAAAVEQLPERVELAPVAPPRRGEEEAQRVLRAVHEVRVLLGGHAGAAEVLPRARRRERVAERERVHLLVLVRQRLRGPLALHVIGEDHVAAFRQVLGEPPVHPLRSLNGAGGDHDAGIRPPQPPARVRVACPGERGEHVAPDQRAVAVRVGHRDAHPAPAGPAAAQRIAAVPAGEDVARRDREPVRRGGLLGELLHPDLVVLGHHGLHVRRVPELLSGLAAVGVGDVLVVALEVLERAGRGAGGASARGRKERRAEHHQSERSQPHRRGCNAGRRWNLRQRCNKSRSTKWRMPSWR